MIKQTWVLIDDNIGNNNQAIALANKLEYKYELKKLTYNCFARLPNFLLFGSLIQIDKKILDNFDNLPDLIISSGRRTAYVAVAIKKRKPSVKIIQIMKPNLNLKHFDVIIIPIHDEFDTSNKKIIRITGALNDISNRIAKSNIAPVEIKYPILQFDFIAVIIGGGSKKYNFPEQDELKLLEILIAVQKNNNLPLFISFSSRTNSAIKKKIIEKFSKYPIYDPKQDSLNPYIFMITKAKFVICTGDSISMCSEVASVGRPLYIFMPNSFKSCKHRRFYLDLISKNIAKPLTSLTKKLTEYSYDPLDESKKIVNQISLF